MSITNGIIMLVQVATPIDHAHCMQEPLAW